ncbi:unnamed protein product [Urochloa humidicola]
MSLIAGEDFQQAAHPASAQHQRGWQAEDHVRAHLHQGCRPPLLQHRLQEGRIDMNKRAGELTPEELERLMTVVANPHQFKVPDWFLNRKKDYKVQGW